jgi:hypothetical protein
VRWSKEFELLVEQAAGDCSGRAVSNHDHAYTDAVAVATGLESKAALLAKQQQAGAAADSAGKRKPSDDASTSAGKRAKGDE